MEVTMTAVPAASVAATATGVNGAAVAGSTVQTGDGSPFGNLIAKLAAMVEQNADTTKASQTVDIPVAVQLPQEGNAAQQTSQVTTDQKGTGESIAPEGGKKPVVVPVAIKPVVDPSQQLAQSVDTTGSQASIMAEAKVLTPNTPAAAGKSEPSTEEPQRNELQMIPLDLIVGQLTAQAAVAQQVPQQPKPVTAVPAQADAPSIATAPAVATVSTTPAVLVPKGIVVAETAMHQGRPLEQKQAEPAPANTPMPTSKVETPVVTAEATPSAATPAKGAKEAASPGEAKPAAHGTIRQQLAAQGVQVEAATGEKETAKPVKVDVGFAEVVIREAEPNKTAPTETAAPLETQGKVQHAPLLATGTTGSTEQSAKLQATPQEVAKPVLHEQIVSQVKEKLAAADLGHQGGQVVLRLHPEELGELKIDVRMDSQRLRIDIVTESPTVKEALLNNMNSLKEVLAKQNITMERFDVSTGGNSFQQAFRDGRTWEQQQTAPSRPASRWADPEPVPMSMAAAAAQYGRNREYAMVDVRF